MATVAAAFAPLVFAFAFGTVFAIAFVSPGATTLASFGFVALATAVGFGFV